MSVQYMFNFWNFGQCESLMPKYGNFFYGNFVVERVGICANSGTLANGKFHTQIWQFENWPVSQKPLPIELK